MLDRGVVLLALECLKKLEGLLTSFLNKLLLLHITTILKHGGYRTLNLFVWRFPEVLSVCVWEGIYVYIYILYYIWANKYFKHI